MPTLGGATGWVKSDPLGPAELRGHVYSWTLRSRGDMSSIRIAYGKAIARDQARALLGLIALDLNRLRRASDDSAIAIAASIFLDTFNVFLLLLERFGGSREWRERL